MSALDVGRLLFEGLLLAAFLALPLVFAAFLAGVISAGVQRVARVSEPVIGLVPRLMGVGLAALWLAPWMSEQACSYARRVLALVSLVAG